MNIKNQLHSPRRLSKTYKGQNEKVRMYLKKDGCSMLIAKDLTYLAAESLGMYITRFLKEHNTKLNGVFIYTH